jgi:hypothetical protein
VNRLKLYTPLFNRFLVNPDFIDTPFILNQIIGNLTGLHVTEGMKYHFKPNHLAHHLSEHCDYFHQHYAIHDEVNQKSLFIQAWIHKQDIFDYQQMNNREMQEAQYQYIYKHCSLSLDIYHESKETMGQQFPAYSIHKESGKMTWQTIDDKSAEVPEDFRADLFQWSYLHRHLNYHYLTQQILDYENYGIMNPDEYCPTSFVEALVYQLGKNTPQMEEFLNYCIEHYFYVIPTQKGEDFWELICQRFNPLVQDNIWAKDFLIIWDNKEHFINLFDKSLNYQELRYFSRRDTSLKP